MVIYLYGCIEEKVRGAEAELGIVTESKNDSRSGQDPDRPSRGRRSSAKARLPGQRRLKSLAEGANSTAGSAYQGAFEAVLSIVIAIGFGYWIDARFDVAPVGLVVGAILGFSAFVLRLMRMGKIVQKQVDVDLSAAHEDPDESSSSGDKSTRL